jgi:hydrogenase expression/formation protein HypE
VSGAGVEIDRDLIPVYTETRIIADALGLDPLGMLGSGALLIAADPRAVPIITRDLAREGIPVTIIGRLTADPEDLTLLEGGERRPLPEFLVDEVARALNRPTLSLVDQPPGDR